MNKRGQIYLLAALIIAVAVFSISAVVNWVDYKPLEDDFDKLARNYELESAKFINSLFLEEIEDEKIFDAFSEFTIKFSSYARSQSSNFGLIYAFNGKDAEGNEKIQIGNFFDTEVLIDFDGDHSVYEGSPLSGCYEYIKASVSFSGFSFSLNDYEDFKDCIVYYDYSEDVYVGIDNVWYHFEVYGGNPEVMIVSRLEEGEQRKVFIGGKGFTPGENG